MRPIFAAVFGLLFLVACSVSTQSHAPADSTVKVITEGGHGSGVHIGNNYVLTAAHVVKGSTQVGLKTSDGEMIEAEVLWANPFYDVALLRISDAGKLEAATLSCRVPEIGEPIMAKGNPVNAENISVWGKIAGAERQIGPWRAVVVTDIATAPGQSGGGVFDTSGNLIGLTVGVMSVPLGFASSLVGIGYVVPGAVICHLLAKGA